MSRLPSENPEQEEAIRYGQGSVIVVAGAGTGKTRVITERIKYLINEKRVSPNSILALTFTDKAAEEMAQRVADVMPLGYEEPWISTFHSFADRILRKEGLEIGLDISYQILSYPKQWLLVRQNLFDFDLDYFRPLGNPSKFISAMLKFVSRLQDEAVYEEDFKKFVENHPVDEDEKQRLNELAKFYSKYQELKIAKSYLDFGDLILWCLRLFNTRPKILKKYQEQFQHILVDEFQDTNFAQYELVKALFPLRETNARSLIVLGDDNQAIYRFRGAAISNILGFKQDYPDSKIVTLVKNYRSTQPILDASYKLIQNNNPDTLESKLGISKKLIAIKQKTKEKPLVLEFQTLDEETSFVVNKILQLLNEDPSISYKDIAILARANNHLDPFVLALKSTNIPYQVVGNRGLYDNEEIKDALAFIRVLGNTLDSISLYRLMNISVFGISHSVISELLSESRYKKKDLWDCLKASKDENVGLVVKKVEELQKEMLKITPSLLVFKALTDIGLIKKYTQNESLENNLAIKNLNLFLDQIKYFERDYYRERQTTPTILDFLEYIDLMIEAGDNPAQAEIEDIDTVTLSTIHAAKGLEYQAVFMVNLVSGRFPSRERGDAIEIPAELIKETLPSGDEHLQEERRLFYVGMTRAKRHLFLTYAKNYGGKKETVPSGFIKETGLTTIPGDKQVLLEQKESMFGVNSGYRKTVLSGEKFDLDYVSYTQISTYKMCPLKYKFAFVLKIPKRPSHAASFGDTIHNTLRDFHTENQVLGNVKLERLLELYNKYWDDSGYLDAQHKKKRYEFGIKTLTAYYAKEKDLDKNIVALEKTVYVKLAGVKFSGRVDRIDRIEGKKVEIIDYKTGRIKEQKDLDDELQTSLYAWAVMQNLGLDPEVLSLYYIEDLQKVSSKKSLEQIKKQVEEAEKIVEIMKSGDFSPSPGKHCEWCDYKDICPYAIKNL